MRSGDVVLARVQFTDSFEVKTRPALVLFEEYDNLVLAGITSNTSMKGIPLTVREGAIRDSVIKTNYIFTVTRLMIKKKLFTISSLRRKQVHDDLIVKLESLIKPATFK